MCHGLQLLIAQARDANLGAELERELCVLADRRSFGEKLERHCLTSVELPGRPTRIEDNVRLLPPRGEAKRSDQRLWEVRVNRRYGDMFVRVFAGAWRLRYCLPCSDGNSRAACSRSSPSLSGPVQPTSRRSDSAPFPVVRNNNTSLLRLRPRRRRRYCANRKATAPATALFDDLNRMYAEMTKVGIS